MRYLFAMFILLVTSARFVAADVTAAGASSEYVACGCGCCGFLPGEEPKRKPICLYRQKGDDLSKIIDEDRKYAKNHVKACATRGCSMGILYKYCDKPSPDNKHAHSDAGPNK